MSWYKDDFLWMHKSQDWEFVEYGFYPNGIGDCVFNTMLRVFEQKDISDWAHHALIECACLLWEGKRWPDKYNNEFMAKNRIDEYWSKLLHKLNIRKFHKYRPQKSITRDPFYPFYLCCIMFDRMNLIEDVKIPWYLYSPEIWRWRKRLIKDNSKDYVKRLRYLRSLANVMNYENKI